MNMEKPPRVGDTVQVPFGIGTVPGLVLEVYGSPRNRHVLLELDLGYDEDRPTVSFPVDRLIRSTAA